MSTPTKSPESGWRGSAEGWLQAAYDSLVESGVEAVRIQPLAKKLNLSRTSFYWFFKDRDELLAALIERWRAKNTGNLVGQAEAYAESIAEAILNVFDCWLTPALFDSQFEFAVRSWALQEPRVAEEVDVADKARLAALSGMFERFGFDGMSADVRARSTYLTQIGYISMNTHEDALTRMQRIPEYVKIFTGQPPQPRELERFYARHGYAVQAPTLVALAAKGPLHT
ncbi:TetR/AcrR family transcriptional regulator [Pseudomonas sp. LPB0260]|uniref:TetR/AcrR family transcriptional regulator n=1 Tax=Pseudomonas sp. LPB0260 TaxID=2614442 RepID=UPI0015C2467F|nr:TetR/AcrR family transcriptional regulator [Pseudomonas sp. LPB0260]QLC74122.1 TetR/AcrR family transcriptional regulator [Pseudomonas sp. LPB0260]QLC76893.1 TetR/AcrR family transcriptional regulator [Pseudomonas sp. LPB0260]